MYEGDALSALAPAHPRRRPLRRHRRDQVSVAENLKAVRERIAGAGRNPDEITIVAVTKGFGADRCREAMEAGLTILGENRVQEAIPKMEVVPNATWHLIGHLQTNKVRQAAGRFELIHSVDSLRLADYIARVEPRQQVLIEVNAAREPQKSGVAPEDAIELARSVAGLLHLRGLMAMGPAHGDPTETFTETRRLRDEAQQTLGRELPILS
ncbi:MAG: YggS family pyridoxal phosphate-dependent enzyme, partial [Chloroflexi bacterium]